MGLIIVTGGDEERASSILDLADSLKRVRQDSSFSMGCLDFGLAASTRKRLTGQFDEVVQAHWPYRPEHQSRGLAAAAISFLPTSFPGHDALAWIDADSFVQHERLIKILSHACANGGAGVIPAIDRNYRHTQKTAQHTAQKFRTTFGPDLAHEVAMGPFITAEVFAASATSPLWTRCGKRIESALHSEHGGHLCFDAILHQVVYLDALRPHLLPSTCNWQSHLALPFYDAQHGKFVEPSYPFEPILAVSNTFDDKQRRHSFAKRHGGTLEARLSYPASQSHATTHSTNVPAS